MNKYALSFKSSSEFLKYAQEQDIQYIDLNFTDIRGKWNHITYHRNAVNKERLENGITIDSSSIIGWNASHNSDLILKPDISRVTYDPFSAQKTLKVFSDILETESLTPFNRDPRSIAKAAEKYLRKSEFADTGYFGPEIEFFIFDDVKIGQSTNHASYRVDSEEGAYNADRDYTTGNMGHRPPIKGGYSPECPVDSLSDIRAEMLSVMENMGIDIEKHHHGCAPGQCEMSINFSSLVSCADNIQIYKYAVHNVAHSYGKTATFMPKPVNGYNGSGMHIHQSLWKASKPLFHGGGYADLSETALYYIGGIIKHAKTLNAFTNPTTNSYKRLLPDHGAPVFLAYSTHNRSVTCRIPYAKAPKEKRIELSFPDPSANPYLALSAILMAGLDGVENKIHPGESLDKNLHEPNQEEERNTPCLSNALSESLNALKKDQDFLLKGDVFSKDFLISFINLKEEEIKTINTTIHPAEFSLYYSV